MEEEKKSESPQLAYAPSARRVTTAEKAEKEQDVPEAFPKRCVFFGHLYFTWLVRVVSIAASGKLLHMPDLGTLPEAMQPDALYGRFMELYAEHLAAGGTGIGPVLYKQFKWRLYASLGLLLLSFASQLAAPLLIGKLVSFLIDSSFDSIPDPPVEDGITLGATLVVVLTVGNICRAHSNWNGAYVGVGTRSVLLSLVYRRSLELTPGSLGRLTAGKLVNMMTTDCNKFREYFFPIVQLLGAPFIIITAIGLLLDSIGWYVLVGMTIMFGVIPLTAYFGRKLFFFQLAKLAQGDKRTSLLGEVLAGISVVKSYGWDEAFRTKIMDVRAQEAEYLRKTLLYQAAILPISLAVPVVSVTLTFVLRVADKGDLPGAENSITTLALLSALVVPFTLMPLGLANLVQMISSLSRINSFLEADLLKPSEQRPAAALGDVAVKVGPTDVAWTADDPVLRDVDVEAPAGSFIAIVGSVGSGKSSLLAAMLNEPMLSTPSVIHGSVAYAPQRPFIMNATLRDNILFGCEFDEARYRSAIKAAALESDLEVLPARDETEIGEKGINLSGGQKARVSVARAIYRNADVVILDDPLSAVDAHVGAHMFHEGFCGALAGKTRILVTNQIQYLSTRDVDQIIVLDSGKIVEQGRYRELTTPGSLFDRLIQAQQTEGADDGDDGPASGAATPMSEAGGPGTKSPAAVSAADVTPFVAATPKKTPKLKDVESTGFTKSGRLVKDETVAVGEVQWRTWWFYFRTMTNPLLLIVLALLFLAPQPLRALGNEVLANFAVEQSSDFTSDEFTLFYVLAMAGFLITSVTRSIMWATVSVRTANHVHETALSAAIRYPLSFFHTVPTGRILSRFGRDQNEVDIRLPFLLQFLLDMGVGLATTLVVIGLSSPWVIISFPFLIAGYWTIRSKYKKTAVQLGRIEAVTLSPIFSLFSESLGGTDTIRAFGRKDTFTAKFTRHVAVSDRSLMHVYGAMGYLRSRVQLIGSLLMGILVLVVLIQRDDIDPALASIALTYVVSMGGTLEFFVQFSSDVAAKANCLERLMEYAEHEVEPPAILDGDKAVVESGWPTKGRVEFRELDMRYRPGLPLVLKGLSFVVEPGMRVGICGRTGAGKSSIFVTLLRLVQGDAGAIVIDDVDIATLGLQTLRTRVAIIPQDPVLFSGTVRSNLDPFSNYSDEEVWTALEHCHLADYIRRGVQETSMGEGAMENAREGDDKADGEPAAGPASGASGDAPAAAAPASATPTPDTEGEKKTGDDGAMEPKAPDHQATPATDRVLGLDMVVEAGGSNFSVGQRQLLCLGRALLRQSKILLLDEASSSVDPATDALLQHTIRTRFTDCTILTVAHRINTILDSDRILVMDDGKVAEYDAPGTLLRRRTSKFAALMRESEEQMRRRGSSMDSSSLGIPVVGPVPTGRATSN